MDKPARHGPPPTQPVGGDRAWRPSLGYLAIALGIVACGLIFSLMSLLSPTDVVADSVAPAVPVAGVVPALPVQAAVAPPNMPPNNRAAPEAREGTNDPTPDLASYVAPGDKPTMNEVIERLHGAGVHTGLGAFSPPGTRPPLIGLAVPEDFVLPPGYVRHYQATDDGQRIEPILMFSPDRPGVDAANRPIELPKNGVVPPELAPPGLPIRRIVIPAPTEAGRSGP